MVRVRGRGRGRLTLTLTLTLVLALTLALSAHLSDQERLGAVTWRALGVGLGWRGRGRVGAEG